jgi:VWFA-related protein
MRRRTVGSFAGIWLLALSLALLMAPAGLAQDGGNQQTQQPANPQTTQDVPDAPSTVQPPPPKLPNETPRESEPAPKKQPAQSSSQPQYEDQPPPPPMPPVETVPAGTTVQPGPQTAGPRNQINPGNDLYKISVTTNFVQVPVLVKDSRGRRVDGLLPRDFVVKENGQPQKLTYFTSDPFQLSVAILIDLGMSDVAVQKVNETYSALVGAFSPYDEVALYTYSSAVRQLTDFTDTNRPQRLTAVLDSLKLVRGNSSGPPVLNGPLASGPPMVNGLPVGGPPTPPVNVPPKEAHVLNDAILRAALDLSKRDRTRRKVIFVISDGRERGSQASYRQVMKLLQTHGIQVKAVVLDQGALPVYKQVEKLHHIFRQGYSDILPKYTAATGGGDIFTELTRNSIEVAYGEITSEARNQYTLGYSPAAVKGSSAYRSIEVVVDKKDVKVSAKDGYYPIPTAR